MVDSSRRPAHAGITLPRPFWMPCTIVCLVRPVKPDPVGQIRRAELAIALAVSAMTDGAIVREYLLAERQGRFRVGRQARQRAHVVGHGRNLVRASACRRGRKPACCPAGLLSSPERAPWRMVCSISAELAAPQPVVIVEIGIALGAAAARAMTGRAIVGEGRPAPARGRSRAAADRRRCSCDARPRAFPPSARAAALSACEVVDDRAARVPAECALRGSGQQRPGRIDDPVADRPDDGDVEQPQPPARQRRIQLAQPSHSCPVVAVPVTASISLCSSATQSSRSGMRAASSNCFLREGHSA